MKFDLQECPDLEYSVMNYMTEGCKTWRWWANIIFWRFYTVQSLTILITINNSIHAFHNKEDFQFLIWYGFWHCNEQTK